jgi:hypothetical protein
VYAANLLPDQPYDDEMIIRFNTVAIALLLAVSLASAQPGDGSADTPIQTRDPSLIVPTPQGSKPKSKISGTLADVFSQIKDQEPNRRAGLRASILKKIQVTISMVIIVEDADSYLFAISNWENTVRFPILWDDGSVESHENIARFVRAFEPTQIIKIQGGLGSPWLGDREQKRIIFEETLSKAVDESKTDWQKAFDDLSKQGIVSPGIVVTDVLDSAWPAALALSAARLQPIAFIEKPTTRVHQPLSADESDRLEREIERAAKNTGHPWEGIGDEIDAITLAMNTGTMIKVGGSVRDRLATTDRIGRKETGGSGQRWAWCGQIIGNESRSVYQAMCALFLSMDNGFVWDGYTDKQPWSMYDGTEAGEALRNTGLAVEINDQPRYTLKDWKLRMVRPVGLANEGTGHEPGSSTVFLMNSKGASNVFDLPGAVDGQGKPGHLPILDVPAALHIVHSFSLQNPMSRNTVGGRFLERGVYVYAGSVDEPYLQAFVPTPAIARRLSGSMAFATAVRFDDGDVWKVTVLGDPLVTTGPAGRRIEGSIKVSGAVDLDERSKQRLKDGDFEGAISDLSLLGQDKAVSRIAIALMKEKPDAFKPGVARASIPALFREGEYTRMLDAYERLDADGRVDPLIQDLLWLSSPYLLARSSGDISLRSRIEAILRANIRPNQKIQDAEDLAMHMRNRSPEIAIGVLEALRPTLNENQIKMLDRAIRRVRN